VSAEKTDILRGTLDLLILKTLDTLGPLHGYGIAQRIQQISQDVLYLNQGTLYPALLRLEQRGWIRSEWGVSDNNRKAKYYALTKSRRKELLEETEHWQRMSAIINRLLGPPDNCARVSRFGGGDYVLRIRHQNGKQVEIS
jgi:transcriptional regulator